MEIRLWGTRGSIAAPGPSTVHFGGNTTCAELCLAGGERIIIDAGTGLRSLGQALAEEPQPLCCHLLITHIHWDHILGFPFFLPLYDPRTHLLLDGCARSLQGLHMTLNNRMMDGVFPVSFQDLAARIEPVNRIGQGPLQVGGAVVEGIEIQHAQGGMGFRCREAERTLVFLTDNELRVDAWAGRAPSDFAHFCRGAQLLIHDAQYRPDEMPAKRGWGHSDCLAAVDLAVEADVERLVLTHHDPDRSDREVERIAAMSKEHAASRGRNDLLVEAGREGMTLRV